jgi:hypothetical protein
MTLLLLLLCAFACMQDLASQAMDVAKGTKGLDEVVDSIREHEMQILNSLVDGSALGQHMEVGAIAPAQRQQQLSGANSAARVLGRPCQYACTRCVCVCAWCFLLQDFYLATLKQAVLAANPALAGRVQQALEEVAASSAPAAGAAAGAATAADAPSEA